MRLTIFGATGSTGTCLVEQAVAAGHEVTAVVRDPSRLAVAGHQESAGRQRVGQELATAGRTAAAGHQAGTEHPAGTGRQAVVEHRAANGPGRLRIVTADVMDPAAIIAAVAGADAVLSAIGPRGNGPTTISQDSARSIISAMQEAGTRRLLTISGSVVTDAGEGPFMRYLAKPLVRGTALRSVCADMRRAEDEVRDSGLDWTIMRPPRLTDRPAAGTYRTAVDRNLPRGYTISRADVAACMLMLVTDPAAVHRHICIAN
jgi:putative NADH-flavin reductase